MTRAAPSYSGSRRRGQPRDGLQRRIKTRLGALTVTAPPNSPGGIRPETRLRGIWPLSRVYVYMARYEQGRVYTCAHRRCRWAARDQPHAECRLVLLHAPVGRRMASSPGRAGPVYRCLLQQRRQGAGGNTRERPPARCRAQPRGRSAVALGMRIQTASARLVELAYVLELPQERCVGSQSPTVNVAQLMTIPPILPRAAPAWANGCARAGGVRTAPRP